MPLSRTLLGSLLWAAAATLAGAQEAVAPHPLAGTWTLAQGAAQNCHPALSFSGDGRQARWTDDATVHEEAVALSPQAERDGLYRYDAQRLVSFKGSSRCRPTAPQGVSKEPAYLVLIDQGRSLLLCSRPTAGLDTCVGPWTRDSSSFNAEAARNRAPLGARVEQALARMLPNGTAARFAGWGTMARPALLTAEGQAPAAVDCERVSGHTLLFGQGRQSDLAVAECSNVAALRAQAASAQALASRQMAQLGNPQQRLPAFLASRHESAAGGGEQWVFTTLLMGHGPVPVSSAVWVEPSGRRAVIVQSSAAGSCLMSGGEDEFCRRLPDTLATLARTVVPAGGPGGR